MSHIREAATDYLARGWEPVALEPKAKQCVHKDWLTRKYSADDFQPDYNIGIKSVNGLVDIDCDCEEAVFFAETFLPKTSAVYGRPSRPRSHWLYTCPDIKDPLALKDGIVKKTVLEIRVNHQSMAPPSTHPEGEIVAWANPDPRAMVVDKVLLVRAVQLVATGSLIARYYNAPGDRHDWGVAMAGTLRRLGINQAEADRLMTRAGQWVKDDKVKDRLDAVRTTYSLSEDTPTTGSVKLAELMGEHGKEFVASIQKIWGGGEAGGVSKTRLEAMNKRHAVLWRQGGKVTILSEEDEDGLIQVRYSNRQEFNLLYPNKVQTGVNAKGQPIFKTLAEAWIEHPKRRFYRGIELAPGKRHNEGYYNLWRGFACEPKKGDWGLFREHLLILAQGNEDYLRYIMAWMADTVQFPDRPVGIALSFKGRQGTGKSTAARWFGALFGSHFMHLDSEHRLLGQFNSHLHNAIVVLADEAVWAGGKQGLGALKRMITEPTLAIEPKGLDVINVKNMLHMIVASNEEWFVPTNFDNRRFAIFEAGNERRNDHKFFGAVQKQLFEGGGLSALLYDLMEFKLDVDLRDIPNTEELDRQKKHTMDAKHAWWYDMLMSGLPWQGATHLPGGGDVDDVFEVDPDIIYQAYVTMMRIGESRMSPGFQASLSRFMRKVLPDPYPTHVQHGGKRFWVFPSLGVSRKYFDTLTAMRSDWPVESDVRLPDIPF